MALRDRGTLSLHPLLRKVKAAALRLAKQVKGGLQRLVARPRSLERLLLFSIAGTVLLALGFRFWPGRIAGWIGTAAIAGEIGRAHV